MRHRLAPCLALVLAAGVCPPLLAADRYVRGSTGVNAPGCTDSANPCQTIQYADNESSCGDTIHIHGDGGTVYDETVSVTSVCTSGNELTFQNWSGTGVPTIDTSTGGADGMTISGDYIVVDGIQIDGNSDDGINASGALNLTIRNTTISNNGGDGIDTNGTNDLTVENSRFISNGQAGIQSFSGGGDDWTIQDNEFLSNGNRGIVFTGNNITVDSNTVSGTVGNQGIDITGGATGAFVVTENTVSGGQGVDDEGIRVNTTGGTTCTFSGNLIYSNLSDGIWFQAAQSGCTFQNNLIFNNDNGSGAGSGLNLQGSNHTIQNNTINGHPEDGVRLFGSYSGTSVNDNILTNNTGYGINDFNNTNEPATESNNLLFNNTSGACRNLTAPKCTGTVNDVLTDPFFVSDFHLSQIAAGEGSDSPALDAGSDTAANVGLDTRTTRTDNVADQSQVDMGYHYVAEGEICAVTTAIGTGDDRAFGMAIYPDGRILLVGQSDNGTDLDIALVRYNANGTLDTSFDGDGIVTTNITGTNDDVGRAAVIQADGNIVVAAHTTDGADRDWAVLRYNSDGSLDTTFGTTPGSGIEVTDIGGTNDQVRALVLEDDEEIVVVGFSDVNSGTTGRDVAVARYTTSGNLDTNFDPVGMDGIVTTNVTTWADSSDFGTGVALQTDGKIVVAGRADFGGNDRAIVIRYDIDGGVDTSFSPGGSSAGMDDQDVGPGNDTGQHVAIHTDGTIAIAGETEDASAVDDILVLRYDSNGNLDNSFDGDGIAVTAVGPGAEGVRAVMVQGDGKIVVGGYSHNGTNFDQVLVRYNTDGSLDTTFGEDGIVTTAIGLGDDYVQVVGVHPQGGLIAGGSSDITGTRDFAWVRYNIDGSVSSDCVNIYYRSMGNIGDYTDGTGVTVTRGSRVVTGSGTTWQSSNRGLGDRITIASVDYTIHSVDAEDQITLTTAYTGTSGAGKSYNVERKFKTASAVADWESCVSAAAACTGVSSPTLANDQRREIGVVYDDGIAYNGVTFNGSTTAEDFDITLTVATGNRHAGVEGTGATIDNGSSTTPAVSIRDDHVDVEWLELTGGSSGTANGVRYGPVVAANRSVLRNLLIYNVPGEGIEIGDSKSIMDIYNNIVYEANRCIRFANNMAAGSQVRILNNTVYSCNGAGSSGIVAPNGSYPTVTLRNNIAHSNNGGDYLFTGGVNSESSHNLSSDGTAASVSPGGGDQDVPLLSNVQFQSAPCPGSCPLDLHLVGGASVAEDNGADLSSIFNFDIDGGGRATPWDIGADDVEATTAVTLASFEARGLDGAVELTWATGSEIDNLGFQLYRSNTETGPYVRISSGLIPGLGSSPEGARYNYLDSGLTNGMTYYYELEDIETNGVTELHGPVSATPSVGGSRESGEGGGETGEEEGSPAEEQSPRITYGDPWANKLHVKPLGRRGVELELVTEGFYAYPEGDGTVRLESPGLELVGEPGEPTVPVYQGWVEALVGRKVQVGQVRVEDVQVFTGLRPSSTGAPDVVGSSNGTARAGARKVKKAFLRKTGLYPEKAGQVLSVGFQGEVKKAQVELAPLRWDERSARLLMAKRLRVRILFRGRERSEIVEGGRGRRHVETHASREVLARFAVVEPGLYAVRFEDVFGKKAARKAVDKLSLSRQGQAVPFAVMPNAKFFKRGSALYFLSEGADVNPYGVEAVYELEASADGLVMTQVKRSPEGAPVSHYWRAERREENRLYQAAFVEADDLWQWDWILGPMTKSFPFQVENVAPSSASSRLDLWLQGASDFPADPDHHVRVYVNDALVAEDWWDGEVGRHIAAELGTGLLQEGENVLEIEDLGDTEAAYSMVMLDRFQVSYPALVLADRGLEGGFDQTGAVWLPGLPRVYVVDVTGKHPLWVKGVKGAEGSGFEAEEGHRYLVFAEAQVQSPEIRMPLRSGLRNELNAAEYLVIGPRELLGSAEPLLRYRWNEGLKTKAVAVEDIYSEFGHGESTAESIREFVSYVYHHWSEPSLRYVLLLGDATYDTKDYLGTGVQNRIPVKLLKTRYLWTASDPWLAAVNGEDILPDVAIGRLPAASAEEVSALVQKILEYEAGQVDQEAPIVLVTDNPDAAGDFDWDADNLAATVLLDQNVEKIYLSELGTSATRSAILSAFDEGPSIISFIGHGAIHLWADENLFDREKVNLLSPQAQQPLLFTMNCLNGYFHFPYHNSLSEELLKAEEKGVIAAFSPTGLSQDEPAHRFHKALLDEMVNRRHDRLGDAILDAQADYADSGALPELLSIYHLLGDPALNLR